MKTEITRVTSITKDSVNYGDCAELDSGGRGYLNWAEVDLFPEDTADALRRLRART